MCWTEIKSDGLMAGSVFRNYWGALLVGATKRGEICTINHKQKKRNPLY